MNKLPNGVPFQSKKKSSGTTSGNAELNIYRQIFTATEGQTVFNLNNTYQVGKNKIRVIVGRVEQFSPENFRETTNKSITLSEGVPLDTEVVVEIIN